MSTTAAQTHVKEKILTRNSIKEPPMYNVVYLNDAVTSADFVAATLVEVFGHNRETAESLTMQIHHQGSAVVATLPYEMAEQKGIEVTLLARTQGFPLTVKIESV